jgi:hypothetical protein
LTDAGGRMLAEGLKANCSVTEVDLRCNKAVMMEAKEIAEQNKEKPEQRRAEVAAMKQKYDSLMSSAPALHFDCSGLYDPRLLLDVVVHAVAEHAAAPASVKSINFSHNLLTLTIAAELQQLLHRFPALQHVNVSGNPSLGSAGVTAFVSSLAGA